MNILRLKLDLAQSSISQRIEICRYFFLIVLKLRVSVVCKIEHQLPCKSFKSPITNSEIVIDAAVQAVRVVPGPCGFMKFALLE